MASASSATRLTNSIALLKFSNFKSRVSQSPSLLQSARREREFWISFSLIFICVLQKSSEIFCTSAVSEFRLQAVVSEFRLQTFGSEFRLQTFGLEFRLQTFGLEFRLQAVRLDHRA